MDVDPHLGLWWWTDRSRRCINRPPAFGIAKNHPAFDPVQAGVFHRFVGRAEDQRRAGCPQQRRCAIHQNHAKAREPIRHTQRYYCLGLVDASALRLHGTGRSRIVAPVPLVTGSQLRLESVGINGRTIEGQRQGQSQKGAEGRQARQTAARAAQGAAGRDQATPRLACGGASPRAIVASASSARDNGAAAAGNNDDRPSRRAQPSATEEECACCASAGVP